MSRSLSAVARNFDRLARSTHRPDGYGRGHRLEELDDVVGDALYTPAPEPEVEDRYSRLADALESVQNHPLVKKYGFAPCNLITAVDEDFPVAMGFEVLAITLAACNAARELADLTGKDEVCKILGWTSPAPEFLKSFGADRLRKNVGALQTRIEEIRAERARPASTSNHGGIRPRLSLPVRTTPQETPMSQTAAAPRTPAPVAQDETATLRPARPALVLAPAPTPVSPTPAERYAESIRVLVARIEDLKEEAARLNSPGAYRLLMRAGVARTLDQAERLVKEAERMLRRAEEIPLPEYRAPRPVRPAPAAPRPVRAPGKTARKRAKEKARRDEAARLAAANPKPTPAPKTEVAPAPKKGAKNGKGKGKKGGK